MNLSRLFALVVSGREIQNMASGTVKWFNATKGYEFIQPQGGGAEMCSYTSVRLERAGLKFTQRKERTVEYEIESNRREGVR